MILFAMCLEPLLRHLSLLLHSDDVLGAFADDIGVVARDSRIILPGLFSTFQTFASISNLQLGLPKCVLVPLGTADSIPKFHDLLHVCAPAWSSFAVRQWADYFGPDSTSRQFGDVVKKACDTILRWKN